MLKVYKKQLKKNMATIRPGQTKSSRQRQMLSHAKKLQTSSFIPDEVLYNVFQYLSVSDLLRCCSVSISWREVALIPTLWEKAFKRLPKVYRDISIKAKTCDNNIDWKHEIIRCAKKFLLQKLKKLSKKSMLDSAKKAKVNATRALGVQWLLVLTDFDNKQYELKADEDFIFSNSISIRWNNIDSLALSKLKTIKLYSLTPLFHDDEGKPESSSVCKRSLLLKRPFEDLTFCGLMPLHGDGKVKVYQLHYGKGLYVGLWESSLPSIGDIAFVGVTLSLNNLLLEVFYGTSTRMFTLPPHQQVLDDVDMKYGMHGYKVNAVIRNCRKIFFRETFKEFSDGVWKGDWLNTKQQRYEDYIFYDIKEKLEFTWKTTALKGIISELVIVDFELLDANDDVMWNWSHLVKLNKMADEQDNYSYDNCEIWRLDYRDHLCSCTMKLIKNSITSETTVFEVNVEISKIYVNDWFGTSY